MCSATVGVCVAESDVPATLASLRLGALLRGLHTHVRPRARLMRHAAATAAAAAGWLGDGLPPPLAVPRPVSPPLLLMPPLDEPRLVPSTSEPVAYTFTPERRRKNQPPLFEKHHASPPRRPASASGTPQHLRRHAPPPTASSAAETPQAAAPSPPVPPPPPPPLEPFVSSWERGRAVPYDDMDRAGSWGPDGDLDGDDAYGEDEWADPLRAGQNGGEGSGEFAELRAQTAALQWQLSQQVAISPPAAQAAPQYWGTADDLTRSHGVSGLGYEQQKAYAELEAALDSPTSDAEAWEVYGHGPADGPGQREVRSTDEGYDWKRGARGEWVRPDY